METLNESIQDLMSKIGRPEQKDSIPVEEHSNPRDMEERIDKFTCEVHGELEVKRVYYNFCHSWLPREVGCDACIKIAEAAKKEQERRESKQRHFEQELFCAMERMGIPARFNDKTFDNFKITGKEAAIFAVCKSYAEKFMEIREAGTSLILCGNTGAGKTHLACAIAYYIVNNHMKKLGDRDVRLSIKFIEALKAIRTVKQTYSSKDKTEQDAIDELVAPDLLILDEVGVQFGSDAEKMILFEIMNERYLKMKPSIIISNLAVQALNEFIGERVIDRLKENNGRILVFDWNSKRDGKFKE
jgi:DNA replication protein DnaC